MRLVVGALLVTALAIWCFNAGLEVGLRSKPTIALEQCKILTQYEDGSIDCDPDGLVKND